MDYNSALKEISTLAYSLEEAFTFAPHLSSSDIVQAASANLGHFFSEHTEFDADVVAHSVNLALNQLKKEKNLFTDSEKRGQHTLRHLERHGSERMMELLRMGEYAICDAIPLVAYSNNVAYLNVEHTVSSFREQRRISRGEKIAQYDVDRLCVCLLTSLQSNSKDRAYVFHGFDTLDFDALKPSHLDPALSGRLNDHEYNTLNKLREYYTRIAPDKDFIEIFCDTLNRFVSDNVKQIRDQQENTQPQESNQRNKARPYYERTELSPFWAALGYAYLSEERKTRLDGLQDECRTLLWDHRIGLFYGSVHDCCEQILQRANAQLTTTDKNFMRASLKDMEPTSVEVETASESLALSQKVHTRRSVQAPADSTLSSLNTK